MTTKRLVLLALIEIIGIALGVCLFLLGAWYVMGFVDQDDGNRSLRSMWLQLSRKSGMVKPSSAAPKPMAETAVFARGDQTRREWTWVSQSVTPGWWSRPVKARENDIVREVDRAVANLIKSLDLD